MADFEKNLEKLEELTQKIKRSDITLEEALASFEEGIKLSQSLEKELNAMESKIQILMKEPAEEEVSETKKTKTSKKAEDQGPVLDLFSQNSEINGTRS